MKEIMLGDGCAWNRDYNDIVQDVCTRLASMASAGIEPVIEDINARIKRGE